MKYSLTHCYTDKNKGDAAIIIATTQLIKSIDKNAEINMFSTYGANDERFKNEHNIIKKYSDNLFPSCFHDPLSILGFGDKSRLLSFSFIVIKSALMLISKNKIYLKALLSKDEYDAVISFLDSDLIISKGGSYLTTQNTSVRQALSLIRMLYPFILANRYNKRMVIFSQSLGPVSGKFSRLLFDRVLSKVDSVYLREGLCKKEYTSVRNLCKKVKCKVIADTAFYLKNDDNLILPIKINIKKFNVGFTLVDHAFKYIESKNELYEKRKNYRNSIIDSIKYLIDNYNSVIHIFPQVLVDNSFHGHNDMKFSKEIKDFFNNTKYGKNVNFYDENWTPMQLRDLYGKMNLFIGTRLHSVIFALSRFVPSINIAYHGTKSQGILGGIKDYEKYVIDINTITSKKLINHIELLYKNKDIMKKELKVSIAEINKKLEEEMKIICATK